MDRDVRLPRLRASDQWFAPDLGPGYQLLGAYGPGIQAWYNEWIQPDPTRSSAGAPTRVLSGLEELWQTSSTNSPATGFELFHALTQYNGNQAPDCILVLLQQLVCQNLPQNTISAVHPDQHAGIFIPDGNGGTTLLIGNDGGVYRQHVSSGQELSVGGFGRGSQTGLQTLEPYGVSIARDGTIYAGLQDNGNVKITSDRRQFETLGGDGVFTAVDPGNSKVAYSTLPDGVVFVTTDSGHSWRNASPGAVTNPSFYTPLAMDPLHANHLVTGGREVVGDGGTGDTGGADDESPSPGHPCSRATRRGRPLRTRARFGVISRGPPSRRRCRALAPQGACRRSGRARAAPSSLR